MKPLNSLLCANDALTGRKCRRPAESRRPHSRFPKVTSARTDARSARIIGAPNCGPPGGDARKKGKKCSKKGAHVQPRLLWESGGPFRAEGRGRLTAGRTGSSEFTRSSRMPRADPPRPSRPLHRANPPRSHIFEGTPAASPSKRAGSSRRSKSSSASPTALPAILMQIDRSQFEINFFPRHVSALPAGDSPLTAAAAPVPRAAASPGCPAPCPSAPEWRSCSTA